MNDFARFRLDTVNQCLWRRRDKGGDERILQTPKAFEAPRLANSLDHRSGAFEDQPPFSSARLEQALAGNSVSRGDGPKADETYRLVASPAAQFLLVY